MQNRKFARIGRLDSAARVLLVPIVLLLCVAGQACTPEPPKPTTENLAISDELWRSANHGRVPLREDGYFEFPPGVERVMVDVGAYKLRQSLRFVRKTKNTGVVAIEPMREPWAEWPDNPRIVGIPAAVSLERGSIDFNINSIDVTSSVLDTGNGGLSSPTTEVRRVPSVRLEDILHRIPPGLDIFLLKTDVQGLDLAVLMSGGDQLGRAAKVLTEIDLSGSYVGDGPGEDATEEEFDRYMASQGFARIPGEPDEYLRSKKWYIDAVYEQDSRAGE